MSGRIIACRVKKPTLLESKSPKTNKVLLIGSNIKSNLVHKLGFVQIFTIDDLKSNHIGISDPPPKQEDNTYLIGKSTLE